MSSPYDEMVTGSGAIRPHWRGLMQTMWSLAPDQLTEKLSRISAQLADDDEMVAPQERGPGTLRPSLDLLPLILPETEWNEIAAGLVQRARLLNMILSDVYGLQHLVQDRLLPPYLVLGNPAFLRPFRHIRPVGNAPHLHFYAADLVRLPGGEWRVFADRTQAAAGVGYAVHKRNVLARTFPAMFRTVPVRQLRSFIDLWQSSLVSIGNHLAGRPRVVLLTPGPYSDAYFEHVFLSRSLGATLVQSPDLTVRNNFLYLKTLNGLVQVDVIYRRVDGDYCDPLELREESALGVAGLAEVARANNVSILNMPGSALAETPAFTPFLPRLAQHLLGEELRLPAVTTWWCGQDNALSEVRAGLDGFAINDVFDADPVPVEPALLSAQDKAKFQAQLLANPQRYVARERMTPSLVPCLGADDVARGPGRFAPRPVVVRVMAVWNAGEWTALPGGIARIVTDHSVYWNNLRTTGITKDVWVLSEGHDDIQVPPVISAAPGTRIARQEAELRSRTADDLFWLGRYIERLDAGSRQFLAILQRLASGGLTARDQAELRRLAQGLDCTGWINLSKSSAPVDSRAFLRMVTSSAAGGAFMRASIEAIRRLTLSARDELSLDMWRTLHRLTGAAADYFNRSSREPDQLLVALDGMITTIAAFSGLASENMARGASWRFLDLGRRIERGVAIAQAVSGVMSGPIGQVESGLRLSLEICDSINAYLLRYPGEAEYASALTFVLADRSNPRGLVYQLIRIEAHLGMQAAMGPMPIEGASVAPLVETLENYPLEIAGPEDMERQEEGLFELLDRSITVFSELSDNITRAFFSHVASAQFRAFSSRSISAEVET